MAEEDDMRTVNIATTVAVFILTLACSYGPSLLKSKFKLSPRVISYLNLLAGGVVLSTFVMHMIPHALISCKEFHALASINNAHHKCKHHHKHEEHGAHGEGHDEHGGHGGHDHHNHEHNHDNHNNHDNHDNHDNHEHNHDHDHKHDHHDHDHKAKYPFGLLAIGLSFLFLLAVDRLFLTHSHCEESKDEKNFKDVEADHKSCHSADVVAGCHMEGIVNASSKFEALMFVFALSLHSVLEGLAMGTQTNYQQLISFMIGLLSHKGLEAFALGVNIFKARFSKLTVFALIFLYSILTPVGILIGIFVHEKSTSDSRAEADKILNGLAAGSFLFVSCIEMIPPEFHSKAKDNWIRFLFLLIGFGIMAGVASLHKH